jgi:hypothetical protein
VASKREDPSMHAIDENGRSVILNEDGSWQFDNSKEWRVVRTYMGDSTTKKTDMFQITYPQWRARVSTEDTVSIYWHEPKSGHEESLISLGSPSSDESYVYLKGTFYLDIFISNGKYRIVVEEKVPAE